MDGIIIHDTWFKRNATVSLINFWQYWLWWILSLGWETFSTRLWISGQKPTRIHHNRGNDQHFPKDGGIVLNLIFISPSKRDKTPMTWNHLIEKWTGLGKISSRTWYQQGRKGANFILLFTLIGTMKVVIISLLLFKFRCV
jgi:hypothetical protein